MPRHQPGSLVTYRLLPLYLVPVTPSSMFERTLQDLIRGLRAHRASSKAQEDAFLAEAMAEIREELRGKDMALKAEGIIKMCYVSSSAMFRRSRGGRDVSTDALSCSCCILYRLRLALHSTWLKS